MSAFGYNIAWQIRENIRTLYRRREALARLSLTYDEYIAVFVPAPARQMFRDITPYTGVGTGTGDYAHGPIDLSQFGYPTMGTLIIRGDHKPAPPLMKRLEVQPDAPTDVVQRIRVWLENGGDAPGDFGRVLKVFDVLNEKYSRAAMRHYWPTIMALCDNNDATKELIPDLQNMRAPAGLKPLPPGLIAACRRTAATISTAQLIPDDVASSEIDEVSIKAGSGHTYKEEGLGSFYGLA